MFGVANIVRVLVSTTFELKGSLVQYMDMRTFIFTFAGRSTVAVTWIISRLLGLNGWLVWLLVLMLFTPMVLFVDAFPQSGGQWWSPVRLQCIYELKVEAPWKT